MTGKWYNSVSPSWISQILVVLFDFLTSILNHFMGNCIVIWIAFPFSNSKCICFEDDIRRLY